MPVGVCNPRHASYAVYNNNNNNNNNNTTSNEAQLLIELAMVNAGHVM
jgi:hypothetical protein